MIYPRFIRRGDRIAVTAPSDGNSKELDYNRLDMAKHNIEAYGMSVIETDNVRTSIKGRSADGRTRAEQFMSVWEDSEVSAVISAKGGDFLMEMLPYIDYDKIASNPKWFQGYSDNTGLTFTITTIADIAAIYCNNFNDFAMAKWHPSIENNWRILCGENVTQTGFDMYQDGFFDGETGDEGYDLTKKTEWQLAHSANEPVLSSDSKPEERGCDKTIDINGRLIGGCLDVLLNLVGTRYDKVNEYIDRYRDDGSIWYLESFSLGSEALERGLWQLGEAGWFANARGFVFGRPAFFESFTDTNYEEAVMNVLSKYHVPVILNADIGHKPPSLTMINGALCNLLFDGKLCSISYKYI